MLAEVPVASLQCSATLTVAPDILFHAPADRETPNKVYLNKCSRRISQQVAGRQCHVSWLILLTPVYLLLLSNHQQLPQKETI